MFLPPITPTRRSLQETKEMSCSKEKLACNLFGQIKIKVVCFALFPAMREFTCYHLQKNLGNVFQSAEEGEEGGGGEGKRGLQGIKRTYKQQQTYWSL